MGGALFEGGPQGQQVKEDFKKFSWWLIKHLRYAVEEKVGEEVDNWIFAISREAPSATGSDFHSGGACLEMELNESFGDGSLWITSDLYIELLTNYSCRNFRISPDVVVLKTHVTLVSFR